VTATVYILAMLRWRNIASLDPESLPSFAVHVRAKVIGPTLLVYILGTLVANSELAVCSWALEAGGSAFASVLDLLAALRCPALAQPVNSPPVSLGLDSIQARAHPGTQRTQCCSHPR